MQFSDLVLRVAEETGLDVTADATKLKAWVNGAYQQISGFYSWPWLLTNFTIQTVADITTLTASVNAAATAVTLSTTYASSLATDYWIRFDDTSDDWYAITAHSAGTASLSIANGYVGSTNLSAGDCTIRRVYYDVPSSIDRVISLRQTITDRDITLVDPSSFDRVLPDPAITGTPDTAYLNGMTSAGVWKLSFYPIPDAKINVQGRGYKMVTELSADADVPLIPAKWHGAIVFTALALYGYDYIDDDRAANAQGRARELLSEMVKEANPIRGVSHVIVPWDTRGKTGGSILPSYYPNRSW